MSSKQDPGAYDCYSNAEPDEDMLVLPGRDRHGAALARLWALMREKEGEAAEVVAEARQCADRMEAWCRQHGKIPLSLDALLSMASALQPSQEEIMPGTAASPDEPLREGDIVVAGRSAQPCRLVRIFSPEAATLEHDDRRLVALRGKANVVMPRAATPTTVDMEQLRRALPDEVAAYRAAGGQ